MSFQLVIAEKPSVARSIAAVIGATEKQNGYWQGGGYLVSWCIGHLVSFAEAGQYDEKYCKWRYEDLPILPQGTWRCRRLWRRRGSSLSRTKRNSSLKLCALCSTAPMWTV